MNFATVLTARTTRTGAVAGLAVVTPGWLYGMPPAGWWALLAASVAALAASRCAGRAVLLCLAAVALGLTLDFLRMPPALLMSVCRTDAGSLPALLTAHLLLFPATSAAMLCLLLPRYLRRARIAWLPLVALEFLGMMAAMTLAMVVFQRAAAPLGWEWGPDGWACAMATGMIGFEFYFGRYLCWANK